MSRVLSLRSELQRFVPTAEETDSVAEILELISRDEPVMSDDYYTPGHITASAFVVDSTRSQLLLIHHGKLRTWLQPGGHVDPGESVQAAALREVQEETGIVGVSIGDGIFDVDVHAIPPNGDRPAHTHFDVRYLLQAEDMALVDSDEVLGARWVPFDQVAKLVTDRSVLRATRKILDRFPFLGK